MIFKYVTRMPKKNLILLILIISFSLLVFNFLKTQEAKADPDDNVWGWAWGGSPEVEGGVLRAGSGWISFNCYNEYYGGSRENRCGSSNYGVHISDDGTFSGYAWSGGGEDHVGNEAPVLGWIHFAPVGPYPEDPQHSVQVDTDGYVSGWARACAVFESGCSGALDNNRGGWTGWIKLRGTAQDGSPYGVWIDSNEDPAEFRGWAWGGGGQSTESVVIGWIDFTGVKTDFSFEDEFPEISNLQREFPDPCVQSRIPKFSWDIDTADPYYYEFRICEHSDCGGVNDPLVMTEEPINSVPYEDGGGYKDYWATACTRCCPDHDDVQFGGHTYYGQVRASYTEDGLGGAAWVSRDFTTKQHCYPYPDFSLSPDPPIIEVPTEFSDNSRCYDVCPTGDIGHNCDSPGTTFAWTFTGVYNCIDPALNCETARNPEVEFSSSPVTVQLEVTDPEGYSCPLPMSIFVRPPLPKYIEVAPF